MRLSTSRNPWRWGRHSGMRRLDALMCNKVNNNHEHCKQWNTSLSIQAVGQKAVVSPPPLFGGILIFVCDVKCLCFSRSPLNRASQYRQKRLYPCTLLSWKHLSFLSQPCFRLHTSCAAGDAGPAPAHIWRGLAECVAAPCHLAPSHISHMQLQHVKEQAVGKNMLLFASVPFCSLLLSLLKLNFALSSPLSLVHQSDILAYLSLPLKSSSSLPSSPQVPCSPSAFLSCLVTD